MSYNLIFIDESESMQRSVAAIFLDNPEFKLTLVNEPSSIYKAAKNFIPDIIVLSYNTIDTGLKKSITEIKTGREFSNVPLVLLVPSDLSDNERETLINLKADGFIYRPFDKDAFISKIKRTLNGGNAVSNTSENTANAVNTGEKIYDIESFENKKTNTESVSEQEHVSPESSELSQAFENLFKDDTIFKEFQNLNKKEEQPAEQTAKIPDVELIAGINEPKGDEPAAPYAEAVEQLKEQFAETAAPAENAKPEPIDAGTPEEIFGQAEPPEPGDSDILRVSGIFGSNGPSEPVKPAGIFELNTPDESFESAVSFDSIQEHMEHHHEDAPAPAFNEPFAGFNMALSEPESYKLNADIDIKKSEGESNLKILDEQNLVKLEDYLKNAIEKTIEDIKPQIIETIKTGLPEIIERLVKEEIEKIKQQ